MRIRCHVTEREAESVVASKTVGFDRHREVVDALNLELKPLMPPIISLMDSDMLGKFFSPRFFSWKVQARHIFSMFLYRCRVFELQQLTRISFHEMVSTLLQSFQSLTRGVISPFHNPDWD